MAIYEDRSAQPIVKRSTADSGAVLLSLVVSASTETSPSTPDGSDSPQLPRLTPGEARIVYLMSSGHTTPEIAKLLELRPRTVENHKRHIYEKLGVSSQSHAVARAISLGLLDAPGHARPSGVTGGARLYLVQGTPTDCRDEVVQALVAQELPFVVADAQQPLDDYWERWYGGPVTAVLVDPEPVDWALPASLGAATVVVRTTGVRDQSAITDALSRGANGLVFRDDLATDLGPVLAMVAQGLFAMSGVYTATLAKWAPTRAAAAPELTAREHDILRSIASGHTIRQTARLLGIAAKTVENTQARLFRKLGTRNRTETLTIADRWGLVDWTSAVSNRTGVTPAVPQG